MIRYDGSYVNKSSSRKKRAKQVSYNYYNKKLSTCTCISGEDFKTGASVW